MSLVPVSLITGTCLANNDQTAKAATSIPDILSALPLYEAQMQPRTAMLKLRHSGRYMRERISQWYSDNSITITYLSAAFEKGAE